MVARQNKFIAEIQEAANKKMTYLEKRIQALETNLVLDSNYYHLERKLLVLEVNISSPRWEINMSSSSLESKVNILGKKINKINPSKESTAARLEYACIKNSKDMRRFLEENIPTSHFRLPTDYHAMIE